MRRCRPLLGTYVEISIAANPDCQAGHLAIHQAFEAMALVGRLMSFHDRASELSAINRHAYRQPVAVHPWTYAVLVSAKALYMATHGAFDCSIAPVLQKWGLLPTHADQYRLASRAPGRLDDLDLTPPGTVRFKRPLRLDLGGIAKGYAVDRAVEALLQSGVRQASVNAGGDLRVLGPEAIAIHVRDPADPIRLKLLGHLSDGAIATSGPYFSQHDSDDGMRAALVHPKTGTSITAQKSYSVIAPSCVVADGLTKALAVDVDPTAHYFKKYQSRAILL